MSDGKEIPMYLALPMVNTDATRGFRGDYAEAVAHAEEKSLLNESGNFAYGVFLQEGDTFTHVGTAYNGVYKAKTDAL